MNRQSSVNLMVKIALLSVISFVIMFIEFPLPLFPPFLKIDMSDIGALVGTFAFGPLAGIAIELLKNILHLMRTSTGGVGELANFIVGAALVGPAGLIYARNKTMKSALLGLGVGTLVMGLVGAFANYYILIPFYANFMPIDQIITIAQAANSLIVDLNSYILYAVIPFNILKGIVVSILTLLIYKRISPLLHGHQA
ncbi:ECF transporter S component [Fusibacter sp. JL216-2]|uniref:ECF transporter S component n=1 Tax=Fusibacter sp. JL216-2 TaxID=3071453 RepID=UPI003D32741E